MTGIRNWPQGRRRGLAIVLALLLVAGIAAAGYWFFTLCQSNQQRIDDMRADIGVGQVEEHRKATLEAEQAALREGNWREAVFAAPDGADAAAQVRTLIDGLTSGAAVDLQTFDVQSGDDGTLGIDVTVTGETGALTDFLEALSAATVTFAADGLRLEPAQAEEEASRTGASMKAMVSLQALWLPQLDGDAP